MQSTTTRRTMIRNAIAATPAIALVGTVAHGASTSPRPVADIPIRSVGHWDHVVEWNAAYTDFVCVTPAEREALLAARPEMADWDWLDFGDRFVGKHYRAAEHWTGDDMQDMKMFTARAWEVKRRRQAEAASQISA